MNENYKLHVPPGHYYSPIPSDLDIENSLRWVKNNSVLGVDLNLRTQVAFFNKFAKDYKKIVDWLLSSTVRFKYENTWLSGSDAITTSLMLLNDKPDKVLEIGAGNSTALLVDFNEFWLSNKMKITSIDPEPVRVKSLVSDLNLIDKPVQQVDIKILTSLNKHDFLMIDNSHVLKTGSDVNYLFTEIFPQLKKGVRIHIHDIFFPFEYPESWLKNKVAFSEIYALRLLLQESKNFKIIYWNDFLEKTRTNWFTQKMPLCLNHKFPTGGIWIERT